MVNNKSKASVSIAASSREATRMSHPPAGFTVTRRWDRQLRAFAAQGSCPVHFHLKLVITSQKVLPAYGLRIPPCGFWSFLPPLLPNSIDTPVHSTVLSNDPSQLAVSLGWFFFSFTGSCYKRSIPKLYMEWFSLFRDSQLIVLK